MKGMWQHVGQAGKIQRERTDTGEWIKGTGFCGIDRVRDFAGGKSAYTPRGLCRSTAEREYSLTELGSGMPPLFVFLFQNLNEPEDSSCRYND